MTSKKNARKKTEIANTKPKMSNPEKDALEKQLAERKAKWQDVTATQMFGALWHKCTELSEMMDEARTRLWEEASKGEGNHYLNDALDQAARCFVDQLYAIATFARHAFLWRKMPSAMTDALAWMKTAEGIAAMKEADTQRKPDEALALVKTPEGFKLVPSPVPATATAKTDGAAD